MNKIKSVFIGRYGTDQLNITLLLSALFLSALSALINSKELILIGCIPLLFYMYRAFSKQHISRYKENIAYIKILKPVIKPLYIKMGRLKDKEHKYCQCPSCNQTIRVEKQKGKINVSCPTCKSQFIK